MIDLIEKEKKLHSFLGDFKKPAVKGVETSY
jgi:hypothetical protein